MKIQIGVMFGGESVEHEVSVISAMQAMAALDSDKYEVTPIYIAKNRQLYCSEALRKIETYKDLKTLVEVVPQVSLIKKEGKVWIEQVKSGFFKRSGKQLDVIIPVIHGTNGEDGTIQGYLEMLQIPYSGCDVVAAAVGQDKVIMKNILANENVPMCPWFWFYGHEFESDQVNIMNQVNQIGYPVILKPACLGSSVGICMANNDAELIAGVSEARQYDQKILVEKKITELREINCSVLGSCFEAKASVLEEVGKQDEILSYRDKYQGHNSTKGSKGMASTARIVPAPLSEEETKHIQALALKTFKVLGTSGVCRIDFMMDGSSNDIYVNEINTIPGSLAFYLWEASGINFSELMDALVNQAIDRQRRREKMIFSYDTNLLATYSSSGSKGSKGVKK